MKRILFLFTITIISSSISPQGAAQTPLGSPSATASPSTIDFENVTVTGATNMSTKPKVTAESSLPAAKLKVKDLVVGNGEAANPTSSDTVARIATDKRDALMALYL